MFQIITAESHGGINVGELYADRLGGVYSCVGIYQKILIYNIKNYARIER